MTRPEAVIFDIGNVLIEWQPERFYDRVMPVPERKRMFAEVDLDGMNRAIDLGAPFRDTIYATAAAHPDFAPQIRMWHDHWIELASPAIPHSVRLLGALKARGVPVFTLTNFGIDSFEVARAHYPFLDAFDRSYVSGHLGVIKPDPRIYEIAEADCGIAPDRLLFTDDRAANVAAARARGWQAHHFDGAGGWAAALVAAGLLDPAEARAA